MTTLAALVPGSRRQFVLLGLWLVVCFVASAAGSTFTNAGLDTWYRGLVKPAGTPPDWVFPVVWTILFVMMAFAAWRASIVPAAAGTRTLALVLFVVQLGANVSWSAAFFGARSPELGLVVVLTLFFLVVATAVMFRQIDRLAGTLMLPYAAWVAYAAYLNAGVWRLNP